MIVVIGKQAPQDHAANCDNIYETDEVRYWEKHLFDTEDVEYFVCPQFEVSVQLEKIL